MLKERKMLLKLCDDSFINWKFVCDIAELNYQTFRNAKTKNFVNYSDDKIIKLINTLSFVLDTYREFINIDL